jgi:CRP-like cAMP-binding protein
MGDMTLTESVKGHRFLGGLSDSQAEKLTAVATEVRFRENEPILAAGERARYFYLLLEGSVCVEVAAKSFVVCIQALGQGEAFGWSAFLDRHDTLFQVRAREDSLALRFDGIDLARVLETDPVLKAEVLRRALGLAAERVQATEALLAELCGVRTRKPRAENC